MFACIFTIFGHEVFAGWWLYPGRGRAFRGSQADDVVALAGGCTRMEERPAASSFSTLAQRLRRLAATRQTIDVAQMQFIEIEDLRLAYGERWPREKTRITAIASHYINRRLDPEDILIAGDDGFLLVFGVRTGLACEVVAQNIARSLNEFFLGEGRGPPTPALEASLREMSIEEIAEGIERSALADEPPAAETEEQNDVVYQPAWDARNEAVTTYQAFVTEGAERVPGYQFDAPTDERRSFAVFDELMLKRSEAMLQGLVRQGRKALVGVSLHAGSITNESALLRLLAIATQIDPKIAPYRVLRFAAVSPGYPRLRLERSLALVQGRVARVSISLNVNEPSLGWVAGLPVSAIGFALPEHTIDGPAFTSHVLPRVKSAVAQAHQHRKTFFVEGPVSHEKAARLVEMGVDAIESPLIWAPTARPRGVLRWPAANLGALPV